MKRGIKLIPSRISVFDVYPGVSIEQELRKALQSGEPLKATANIAYTERKDGVLPQYDIRTDRFELALIATDKANKSAAASRHAVDFPELYEHDQDGNVIMENGKPKLIQPKGEA